MNTSVGLAKFKLQLTLITCLILLAVCQGCGGGSENAVIMPGEDYQLTETEQAYKEAEDKMRKDGN